MFTNFRGRRAAGVFLAFSLAIVSSAGTWAQEIPKKTLPEAVPPKAKPTAQRASGVILKAVKIAGAKTPDGKEAPATYRLTVNTNAVWRDWVRDQTQVKDSGPPAKDAAAGEDSVASGEPSDANSTVVVDVTPDTKVETRFRTPDDETSTGAKTPEAARDEPVKKDAAKPVQFVPGDLKPGLFVEADFQERDAKKPASKLTVIRPVSPRDASPVK